MTQITHLAPRDICERLGVGMEPVLAWIHRGELKAANVSNSPTRPRWRIAIADLEDFLKRRSNQQKASSKPAKRIPKPRREYV